ncbi:hypothetical protein C7374_10352 [Falsochrobactrum ovis]|uniref:Uncharacterized protein n=1 Tax=Falsochrobactrum ovis TaxID=1293442 RepID=A0A364JWA0_9HYPH|nr:hypothetical protein C7374_10352 [Falsochrobactrum ovis]
MKERSSKPERSFLILYAGLIYILALESWPINFNPSGHPIRQTLAY